MAVTTSGTVSYLGDLFMQHKRPNAFLRLMGGIQGDVKITTSIEFPVGTFYSVPAPSQPARLEGAAAPTPNTTSITQATNVCQIFQEAVSLTYLGMSNRAVSGVVPIPQGGVNGPVQNPRSQEFQVARAIEKIAQDANYSMLNGIFTDPGDPTATALGMRGILTAISTNLIDHSTVTGTITAQQYRSFIDGLLLQMITYNGYQIDDTFTLLCNAQEYSNTAAAWTALGTIYVQPEAVVFGVKVRKIFTTFGTLMLVLDPDVPAAFSTTVHSGDAISEGDSTATLTSVAGLVVGDSLNFDLAGTVETFTLTAINSGTGVVTINGTFAGAHGAGVVVTRGATVAVINVGLICVVGLEVPGKGLLFEEPLYKSGSSEQTQIYGQLSIDHGPEYLHGIVRIPAGVSLAQ